MYTRARSHRQNRLPRNQITGVANAKLLVAVAAVAAVITMWLLFRERLSLKYLAEYDTAIRSTVEQNLVVAYGVAFLAYVLVTGTMLPGAAAMTLLCGWYFGLLPGVLLVSFASTTGATIAFLLSRYLFRDTVRRKLGDRAESFDRALDRDGAFFLFGLRMIPAVPFFVVNAAMGLTPIRIHVYWLVSQVGMLPATIVYVYAGSQVPSLEALADQGAEAAISPRRLTGLAVAFALLGGLPFLSRLIVRRLGIASPRRDQQSHE